MHTVTAVLLRELKWFGQIQICFTLHDVRKEAVQTCPVQSYPQSNRFVHKIIRTIYVCITI